MYVLSPSIFNLLINNLSPCNWQLAEYFPKIQFAILNTIYSHCSRHDHFINNSSLFINNQNEKSNFNFKLKYFFF